jgi:hypothetical protein
MGRRKRIKHVPSYNGEQRRDLRRRRVELEADELLDDGLASAEQHEALYDLLADHAAQTPIEKLAARPAERRAA